MMTFDIRQLRYTIAAADHGSFCRAARALDVEQSTLSRNILKLERAMGMAIFERSRAGVTMTLAGNAFICGARPMVATADKLVAMMRAAGQGRAGGLMLGHNSSVSAGNLRATMMSWRDAHPDVEVECVEANRSALLAGLDTGEIDIAILMSAAGHDGFRCGPLGVSGCWSRCQCLIRWRNATWFTGRIFAASGSYCRPPIPAPKYAICC